MPHIVLWDFNNPATVIDDVAADGTAQNGTFEDGAAASGGALQLDGVDDYALIPADPAFQLDTGTLVTQFSADTVHNGTVLSRDSFGFDGGGHVDLSVRADGSILMRTHDTSTLEFHQTPTGFYSAGDDIRVTFSWDATGAGGQYKVENLTQSTTHTESVASSVTWDMGAGQNEPITIGASQMTSGDNVADNLFDFFDGSIEYVSIFDTVEDPGGPTLTDGIVSGTSGNDTIDAGYTGDPDGDVVDGNDNLVGNNDDVIEAGDGADAVPAGDGNDTIDGMAGDDSLHGGTGEDSLIGGAGNDVIDGGPGYENDTLVGGDEIDTADYSTAGVYTGVMVDLDAGTKVEFGDWFSQLSNIENVIGSSRGDTIGGDSQANMLDGGAGDDSIAGLGGQDTLIGGAGNDTFALADGWGADTITDFDLADTDSDGFTNDQLDVSGLTSDGGTTPVTTDDVVITANGSGDAVLTFPGGESITLQGVTPAMIPDAATLVSMGIPPSAANYVVDGTSGDDDIFGSYTDADGDRVDNNDNLAGNNDDVIDAGDGDDSVRSGFGDDVVFGGDGNDTIIAGDGSDTLIGGAGADMLNGQWGSDTADYSASNAGVSIDLNNVGNATGVGGHAEGDSLSNIDDLVGSDFDDTLSGYNQTFDGRGISNVIDGGGGNDLIDGEGGDDDLYGGTGDDTLIGDTGDDTLTGGAGNDTFVISDSSDSDTITDFAAPVFDQATATWVGADMLDVTGVTKADGITPATTDDVTLTDTNGNGTGDAIITFPDGDSVTLQGVLTADIDSPLILAAMGIPLGTQDGVVDGTAGDDDIRGGYVDSDGDAVDGNDNLLGNNDDVIDAGAGDDGVRGGGGDDTIFAGAGNDYVQGGSGDDLIYLGDGTDRVDAGNGNDTVYGGADFDIISGNGGDDALFGEDGNDQLYGSAGEDTLDGGDGTDWARYNGGDDQDMEIDLATGTGTGTGGHAEGDTYVSIENVWSDDGNDTITGNSENNEIRGEGGYESILGGGGNDTLDGDEGADTIDGGGGNDTIVSGGDGGGPPIVWTDFGNNGSVTGTNGADYFRYEAAAGSNATVILDSGGGTNTDGDGQPDFVLINSTNQTNNLQIFRLDYGTDQIVLLETPTSYSFNANPNNLNGTITYANGNIQAFSISHTNGSPGFTFEDVFTTTMPSSGGGADSLSGGDDADTFIVWDGFGNDTIIGGEGGTDFDTIDLSNLTGPVTVTYTGDEEGTIADGTNTITFSEIERLILTDHHDSVNASADGVGVDIDGGFGDDSILGGSGDDTITGHGRDTVDGGAGDDSISNTSSLNASLSGGNGNDTIQSHNASDVLDGGDGNDLIIDTGASGSADTITGGAGDDTISAGDGNDSVDGGADNDNIDGGTGNDRIIGGSGNDTLIGGPDDDTLTRGDGNDSLTGGAGDDTFVVADNDGNDTITDFDMTLFNNGGLTADQLDLSGLTDANGDPVNVWDAVVTDTNGDGSGDAILTFPNGESITLQGVTVDEVDTGAELHSMGIVCYVTGTKITTDKGDVAVEDLQQGDMVLTSAGGFEPILWKDQTRITKAQQQEAPNLRPVRIKPGAMGNEAALFVSQQHCMAIDVDGQSRFIRAKHLAEYSVHAHITKAKDDVTYHHILLPEHAVIYANGAASESFYPGPQSVKMLSLPSLATLRQAVMPWKGSSFSKEYGPRQLPCLTRKQVEGLQGMVFGLNFPIRESSMWRALQNRC